MAASYPSAVKSFTTKTNYVDLVDASHVNDLQDEVVAVETELGTDVAGSAATLKARLAISLADSGGIQSGTSFPGSPVACQFFYREDQEILYQRNYANDTWNAIAGVAQYSDSTLIETTAATERTTNSGSYVKLKEFSPLIRGGTITIKWEMKGSGGSSARSKVYVNDIAVGTEKLTTETTYQTETETGLTVAPGDIVQIYGLKDAASGTTYIQNAEILCSNPTTPQEASGY